MPVTQRDLVESVSGLQSIAKDLRGAANSKPIPGFEHPVVPVGAQGLLHHAAFLDRVVGEILQLIEDKPVKVPK